MVTQVSGLIAGVMFGLLSGQPLTILGLTGPDLVFESLVYNHFPMVFDSERKLILHKSKKKVTLSDWSFRFTSFAWALAGNTSPFASGLASGLLPCSSYSLPQMPGEHFFG